MQRKTHRNKDGSLSVYYYDTGPYNGRYRGAAVAAIRDAKLSRGACIDCGLGVTERNLVCFDWDHTDPSTKSFNISQAVRMGMKAGLVEKIVAEIAKCELRCANCHRMRTHEANHAGLARRYVEPDPAEVLF